MRRCCTKFTPHTFLCFICILFTCFGTGSSPLKHVHFGSAQKHLLLLPYNNAILPLCFSYTLNRVCSEGTVRSQPSESITFHSALDRGARVLCSTSKTIIVRSAFEREDRDRFGEGHCTRQRLCALKSTDTKSQHHATASIRSQAFCSKANVNKKCTGDVCD